MRELGEVRIERRHYATLVIVRSKGRTVLDAAEDSEPTTSDAIRVPGELSPGTGRLRAPTGRS